MQSNIFINNQNNQDNKYEGIEDGEEEEEKTVTQQIRTRKQRTIHGAYIEIDDIQELPGHLYKNWIALTKEKLKVNLSIDC